MNWLFGSDRSRKAQKGTEPTWMEALEGRVMLSAQQLDSSIVNHITGSGPSTYQFDAVAGQRYLFLDVGIPVWMALKDSAGQDVASFDYEWTPSTSGSYFLSIDNLGDEPGNYDVIFRAAQDDFGTDPATAGSLSEDAPAQG